MRKSPPIRRSVHERSSEIESLLETAGRERRLLPLLKAAISLFPDHLQLRELLDAVSPSPNALEYFTPPQWLMVYKALIASRTAICKIEQTGRGTISVATGVAYRGVVLTSASLPSHRNIRLVARFPLNSAIAGTNDSRGREIQSVRYPLVDRKQLSIGENTGLASLRISSSGDNPTQLSSLTAVENDPDAGDVLLILQEPLHWSLEISIGSVTSRSLDYILMSVRSEVISVGAPCFTADGRFAAIVVAQSATTVVAIPALRIDDELNRLGSDNRLNRKSESSRQTTGGQSLSRQQGTSLARASSRQGNAPEMAPKMKKKTTKKIAKKK